MKTFKLYYLLLAATITSLALSLTACGTDDEEVEDIIVSISSSNSSSSSSGSSGSSTSGDETSSSDNNTSSDSEDSSSSDGTLTTTLTVSGYYKGYPYVQMNDTLCIAVYNMGASSPEGYGDYFYWGALAPIYKNSSHSYKSSKTSYYLPDEEMVSISGDPTYDVAAYEWGGDWRLPVRYEWKDIVGNCTVQATTCNGVAGVLLTSTASGYEGNNLFLPLAGYYNGRKVTETTTYGYYWTGYYWADNAPYSLILTTSGVYQTAYYMLYYNEGATIRPFFTKK